MLASARILSIDPGTNFTGATIMDITSDGVITTIFADTIKTEWLIRTSNPMVEIHGKRFTKINHIGESIAELLRIYNPNVVISEAPYLGRFPQSFAALVELLMELRHRLFQYNVSMPLLSIDPSSVKKSMGVKGNSSDKGEMTIALHKEKIKHIRPVDTMDEHTVDATCVGLYYIKTFLGEYYVNKDRRVE